MSRDLWALLWRMLAGAAAALVLTGVCALFGLRIALPIPLALGLITGTALWIIHVGAARADHLHIPELDLDADYALPHGQDMRVRRLEDVIHGAQPSRRMTARGLGRVLGEAADARAGDPDVPPLSPRLTRLIAEARHPDAAEHPVGPIDRRTLHRYLRELAPGEERDR